MKGNYFIDTNILIYCYSIDEPEKKQSALKIVESPNAFISIQVLTEMSNTLRKKFEFSWDKIKLVLSEIHSYFNVYINKPLTIKEACRIAEIYGYSFYDSLIIAAALACNSKVLYTEDMQDGQIIEKTLKIVNPF